MQKKVYNDSTLCSEGIFLPVQYPVEGKKVHHPNECCGKIIDGSFLQYPFPDALFYHRPDQPNVAEVFGNELFLEPGFHGGLQYIELPGEYLEKIKGGWTAVDVIISTPDSMSELGKLGKILGPKGLMPNPKSGTVTQDVAQAVKEIKGGKIEFRVDKTGIIHSSVGKLNFENDKLVDNAKAFINTIIKMKPASAKGQYVKSLFLSSTMGPGVKISKDEYTVSKV